MMMMVARARETTKHKFIPNQQQQPKRPKLLELSPSTHLEIQSSATLLLDPSPTTYQLPWPHSQSPQSQPTGITLRQESFFAVLASPYQAEQQR